MCAGSDVPSRLQGADAFGYDDPPAKTLEPAKCQRVAVPSEDSFELRPPQFHKSVHFEKSFDGCGFQWGGAGAMPDWGNASTIKWTVPVHGGVQQQREDRNALLQ